MRNIFLWILGLLVSFNLQAQYQSNRFLTGKVIHTQVGASSGKFNVSCNFTDEGGLYDGTNVTVGDLLFISDGGYGFYLPIDSIISSGVSTVIIRVVNTSLSLGAIPTGVGYITKASENFQFQPFVSGISDANQQISNEDFIFRLDSILNYKLPERTDSIPSYTPGVNDSRIAQDNDTGIVYYYDGSNWKRIGQDTLDGIYGRSDTIPDALRQVSIDSVLEFIGLDTSGYFLATVGGEFAGGRLLIKNNQGKLYFYDALSGTSYLSVNREGIVLQSNTNGTDDIKIQGLTRFNSILTPVTLSATANNYNPTGFPSCNVLRLTSTVDVNITGFSNGRAGRLIVIENVGTKTITFVKQNGGSTAANRFGSDNFSLSAGNVGIAVYDSIASRWRVTGSGGSGTSVDTFYVFNDSLFLITSTDTFAVDLGLTVVGDDWGSQVANRDSSLSGNGVTPLGIKGYSAASNGQVPSKATGGITWITPLTAEIDGSTTNEIQQIDTFEIVSNVLRLSISDDNVPFSSVNLGSYLQTLSLDSGTVGDKERFHLSISGGNSVYFDVAKSIYTDNGTAADNRTVTLGGNITWDGASASNGKIFKIDMGSQEISVTKNGNVSLINGSYAASLITGLGLYVEHGSAGTVSVIGLQSGDNSSNLYTDDIQPEGVITAPVSSVAFINNVGTGEIWLKETGSGNTGWVKLSSNGANIYNSDGTTDEAERTVTLLDDINFIGASGTADFYVETGTNGGRLDVSVDSSRLYFTDGSGTNAISSSATNVMLKTGTADQVTILTDKVNLVDASGNVLDFEVKDDTRFKVDSLEDFAIGRWPNFPDQFEYLEKNRYGLLISDNTSGGKKTTIAGMAYDRSSNSYITSDRGSYQLNASNYLSSGTAEMVTGAVPSSFYNYSTHPLEPYDNIEFGFRNQWVGIPKDKTQYAYLYQGGDRLASAPYDTAAITMWIGIPQITDTTATAKSTLGTKAVSKLRGWGVQSLFHRTSTQQIEHPFNWIKVTTGSVAADTLLDGINFYGRYAFENSAPSVTSGDTSLMAWVGTGSATNPIWLNKDQFGGGGGTNIYNANGTTTANTRNVTILESINFISTADFGGQYPFQIKVTGNEPPIQLWKGNTDSVYLYQSDLEYHFGSSTVFQIESSEYLLFQADSITANTLATKTKIQNIVGISNSGTLQQIEGSSGGQVLTWNASGYWELGTGGDGDGIYGGSGSIPDNTVATVASTGDFRIDYNGSNPAFSVDDVLNQTYISGKSGTYSVYADNSNSGLVSGTATWLVGSNYALTATASVANTNTVADRLVIKTNSTGTAATSFGGGILFQGESSTTDNQDMAKISAYWANATHAIRGSKIGIHLVSSGGALTEYANFNTSVISSGALTIGNAAAVSIYNSGITTATPFTIGASSSALTLQSTSNTATAITIQPTNNTTGGITIGGVALTSTTLAKKEMNFGSSYTAASGTGTHTALAIQNTYNLTSTASGLQTSILINPTFTSLTGTYRAIDISANNASAKGIYQSGANTTNNLVGATGFGSTTAPTDKVEITGNLALLTAGNKIKVATGSNASAGTGTFASGTVTINTTAVTASSLIFIQYTSCSNCGTTSIGTVTAATSFVVNSSNGSDGSTFNWWLIN
jgi:hypothetical protein